MVVMSFFQAFLAKVINKFRWKTIQITDNRVRTMNEILNSIKLIKMYAWEDSFEGKITGTSSAPTFPVAPVTLQIWEFPDTGCAPRSHSVMIQTPVCVCLSVCLTDLRKNEKKQLWVVNFIQNINVNLTGIVPTIATVLTFLVHTLSGLSLNTTDVSRAARQHQTHTRIHTHLYLCEDFHSHNT